MLSQTGAFLILCHHKSAPYQPVFAVVVPFIDGLLRVHMSAVRIPILRSLDVCGVRERRDIMRDRQRLFIEVALKFLVRNRHHSIKAVQLCATARSSMLCSDSR